MNPSESKAKSGQYLTFSLRSRLYGVPISIVREINQVGDITPVPQTPEYVVGIMNLRGKVIPVVDLKMKFKMEKTVYTRETCIIVIEGAHGHIGTIVDSVSEVFELASSNIEPPPTLGNEDILDYLIGVGKVDNKVILLINIVSTLMKEITKHPQLMEKVAA